MSGEYPAIQHEGRSPHLPPPEAWKNPGRHMYVRTGQVKHNVNKLVLPTDDRGFIRPHEVVDIVIDRFFWKDYDWPYDPTDIQTRPDDHHFYYDRAWYSPSMHDGDETARDFRELGTNIGRMPRQLHNAIHELTAQPPVPDRDAMYDYIQSYERASSVFEKMTKTAKQAIKQSTLSVDNGLSRLNPLDEAFIQSFFTEHFPNYSIAVDLLKSPSPDELLEIEVQQINTKKTRRLLRKIGSMPTQKYLNFTPLLQTA